jgi:hypothetical protein
MDKPDPKMFLSPRHEKNLLRAAAQSARSHYEISDRLSCPDTNALKLLAARRASTMQSPDMIDHISTCSPCFAEYSRLRIVHKRMRILSGIAAVAVVLFVGFAINWLRTPGSHSQPVRAIDTQKPIELVLDLRAQGVARNDLPVKTIDPSMRLPRSRLALSIYLPIGSEEGNYEVVLVEPPNRAVAETAGKATLRNFVQVLEVDLSSAGIAAGRYEMRLRRGQGQWSSYPVWVE